MAFLLHRSQKYDARRSRLGSKRNREPYAKVPLKHGGRRNTKLNSNSFSILWSEHQNPKKSMKMHPQSLDMENSSSNKPRINVNDFLILNLIGHSVENIQSQCQKFGVFSRWTGLGMDIDAIDEWIKKLLGNHIDLTIMENYFLMLLVKIQI